jgi:23S rRNA (guanine2535-N1)-methyltransferase
MPYRFMTEDQDYSDYSSGRVIYNQPGAPAFPIRLASEILLRALHLLGPSGRLTLYDPTCGSAYHLTALGFLFGDYIGAILASDVDPRAVELARKNLGLLTSAGLAQREAEISRLYQQFGKESHAQALHSAAVLRQRKEENLPIHTRAFSADALDPSALFKELTGENIDLVISDIPYGQLSAWQSPAGLTVSPETPPLWQMLQALTTVLRPQALVAVAADKSQKVAHEAYQRVERFQVGKRQVTFLKLTAETMLPRR